jgi:hypothetical protein
MAPPVTEGTIGVLILDMQRFQAHGPGCTPIFLDDRQYLRRRRSVSPPLNPSDVN